MCFSCKVNALDFFSSRVKNGRLWSPHPAGGCVKKSFKPKTKIEIKKELSLLWLINKLY